MALGSIYVASLLLSFEQPPSSSRDGEISDSDLAEKLTTDTSWDWENIYHTKPADLEGTQFVQVPCPKY
jgi:CTD kinase subunit beta